MKIPAFNFKSSFYIQDKSGNEVPFEVLDNEASEFWKKVYDSEKTATGACPYKNIWSPKCSWSKVLHYTFEKENNRLIPWEKVKTEVTKYLTTEAGNQLLNHHGTTPDRKYYLLRDYYEIIGAYYELIDYWKNKKGYEFKIVSIEN